MERALFLTVILHGLQQSSAIIGPPEETTLQGRQREIPICPSNCYCSVDSAKCDFRTSSVDIKFLSLLNDIRILTLTGWQTETVNATFLQQFPELRWIELNQGNLVDFPHFGALWHLSYIDLSNNCLTSLPGIPFRDAPYITQLNISGNQITDVSEDFLLGLDHLRILDLSRNPAITQLPFTLFRSTVNLRFLDLAQTDITEFPKEWTQTLQNLHFLNISSNKISSLTAIQLAALEVLDASFNPLESFPVMEGFQHLTQLYVSHSSICYISSADTEGCKQLQVLDLSYSQLLNIDDNILSQCINLRRIDLSHNRNLWRIENGALSGLVNLSVLQLNHCPNLYDLEEDSFNGLTNLRELHLQQSGVKVLPYSLSRLQNLTSVNLEGTILLCDCYAHWLPQLLNSTEDPTSWKGMNPIQCQDGVNRTLQELDIHLNSLECSPVYSYSISNKWTLAPRGQNALLECNITGNPPPKRIWLTVDHHLMIHDKSINDHPWLKHRIQETLSIADASGDGKYKVLQTGQLLIRNVSRQDIGRYKCFAYNAVSNTSVVSFLALQDSSFRAFIIESMLFGLACATLFLIVNLIIQLIKFSMDRFGWECCCCKDRLSPKAKQIRRLIESVESYKTAQLDRLRDNYNSQVAGIKGSCYQQMERLRESYVQQSKNLKDLCDYSSQQISGARDQYIEQVNKIRDYSINQMNRVRENYLFQHHRIRKFSGHQLLKLRETYKYQQKTLNKLLETLPDLYIQNCRTGLCQRTDSIVFEDEIDGIDIYYKVDFLDNRSHISSEYYTPTSTLTRQSKGKQSHSRSGSSTSGSTDYQETRSWLLRQGSTKSDKLYSHDRFSNRSFSLVTDPLAVKVHFKGHKRSISVSSQPSGNTLSLKAPLIEENGDPNGLGICKVHKGRKMPESPNENPATISANPTISRSDSAIASTSESRGTSASESKGQSTTDLQSISTTDSQCATSATKSIIPVNCDSDHKGIEKSCDNSEGKQGDSVVCVTSL